MNFFRQKIGLVLFYLGISIFGGNVLHAARYNIAWVCEDAKFNNKYVEIARKLCASSNSGYLLEARSLPHVSICQFDTSDVTVVNQIKNRVHEYSEEFFPKLTGISFLPGENEFANDVWVELSLLREQKLIQVQNEMIKLLSEYSIVPLNGTGSVYRPHLTLSKIDKAKAISIDFSNFPDIMPLLLHRNSGFKIALGIADQNWQFVEKM